MIDKPKEKKRSGPHPLALHIASATQNWTGAAASFPLFHMGGMQIHPDLAAQADNLQNMIKGLNPLSLQLSIMQGAQERLAAMLSGITAYQQHPYIRKISPARLFHRIGTTEVRDYGTADLKEDAPVVIAVPSLVNPAYILDLMENYSFMRYLAQQGKHPYLLDWTTPGAEEINFGLEDYIIHRLIPMIRELHKHHGKKIHLLGYCMGGNLSLAAAHILQKENILASLTLIATPWDFHVDQPAHLEILIKNFLKALPLTEKQNTVPINLLQLFFFSLDPGLSDRKFRKFSQLDPASSAARNFVALEDWANDGAPLAPKIAQDCLINWYQKNQPHRKQWHIAGQVIDPDEILIPGHIVIPRSDRIVPPASAKSLRKSLPRFSHSIPSGGHVSMIAGKQASTTLWPKIALSLK